MKRTTLVSAALTGALVASAGTATAAAPVRGSISGPVTAVKGRTFTVQTPARLGVPKNRSTVTIVSSTVITEQKSGTAKSVRKGLCATAVGTKNAKGVVTAQRVTLRKAVKGSCANGFLGRGAGRRPPTGTNATPPRSGGGGQQQPPGGSGGFRGNASFGFASGIVTAVEGARVSVKGQNGKATFLLAKPTRVERTLTVGPKAVEKRLCVFVNGTSSDKGATVEAESIALSKPTANGCFGGFRGRNGP